MFCYVPSDSVQMHGKPEGIKPKMRDCKLRSAVKWQGVLQQEMHKARGRETRVTCILSFF